MKTKSGMRKSIPSLITAQWLEKLNACSTQVDVFRSFFPKGLTLTVRNMRRAARVETVDNVTLDIEWFIKKALKIAARRVYYKRVNYEPASLLEKYAAIKVFAKLARIK